MDSGLPTQTYIEDQPIASFDVVSENSGMQQPVNRRREDNLVENLPDESCNFLDLQPLEMDFMFDEADMINNHLAQSLPPLNYEVSPSYGDPSVYPTASARENENSLGPLGLNSTEITSEGIFSKISQDAAQSLRSHPTAAEDRFSGPQQNSALATPHDVDEPAQANPWDVSKEAYTTLSQMFTEHQSPSELFQLPSRRTISRYVASWARSYHPHLPVLHLPTKNFDLQSPMLLLTVAAVGSFYIFEHSKGYQMLVVAKSIVLRSLQARRQRSSHHLLRAVPQYAKVARESSSQTDAHSPSEPLDIELLQSLLIIVMTLIWLDKPFAQEGLALSSQLTELTREALKASNGEPSLTTWEEWAQEEERRRTIFSAYFTLNLLPVCFNLPPPMLSSEIILPLPCSEAEFKAPDSDTWHSLSRAADDDDVLFSDCFKQLLQGGPLPKRHANTEFGNYMLMQSLLGQIYFDRHSTACLLSSSRTLPLPTISLYETAFSAWQSSWDLAIDSALDPSSFRGPLAFNSTAMLRLAHVHLAVDLPAQCTLAERDPEILAQAFDPAINVVQLRTPHLHQSILQAINALRIPIRLGISFIASGRTGHWSVQHAISNFYCAVLLTHWLESLYEVVSTDGIAALSREERYCLSMLERLIADTHLEEALGLENDYPRRVRRVAVSALRLWAETCQGSQVYEIVYVIGETLTRAADRLDE